MARRYEELTFATRRSDQPVAVAHTFESRSGPPPMQTLSCEGLRLGWVGARTLDDPITDRDRLPEPATDPDFQGFTVGEADLDEVVHVRAIEHAPGPIDDDAFPGVISCDFARFEHEMESTRTGSRPSRALNHILSMTYVIPRRQNSTASVRIRPSAARRGSRGRTSGPSLPWFPQRWGNRRSLLTCQKPDRPNFPSSSQGQHGRCWETQEARLARRQTVRTRQPQRGTPPRLDGRRPASAYAAQAQAQAQAGTGTGRARSRSARCWVDRRLECGAEPLRPRDLDWLPCAIGRHCRTAPPTRPLPPLRTSPRCPPHAGRPRRRGGADHRLTPQNVQRLVLDKTSRNRPSPQLRTVTDQHSRPWFCSNSRSERMPNTSEPARTWNTSGA